MLGAKIMIILELAKMSSLQFRKKRFLPRGALAHGRPVFSVPAQNNCRIRSE